MIHPINGQVFIIEDRSEVTSKTGIIVEIEKKVSSIGTIYAIAEDNEQGLKKGDRVLFSRYAVEDVMYLEDDQKVPNLKSLHIDAVHAILR